MFMKFHEVHANHCQSIGPSTPWFMGRGWDWDPSELCVFLFCHATHSLSWSYQCCANALASGARFMGPVKEKLQTAMIATVFRFWCVYHPLKRPSQGPLCQDVPKLILLALLVFEKWSIAVTQCHVQSPSWSISANKPQGLWRTMLLVATRAYHHGYHLAFLSQCCIFWVQ